MLRNWDEHHFCLVLTILFKQFIIIKKKTTPTHINQMPSAQWCRKSCKCQEPCCWYAVCLLASSIMNIWPMILGNCFGLSVDDVYINLVYLAQAWLLRKKFHSLCGSFYVAWHRANNGNMLELRPKKILVHSIFAVHSNGYTAKMDLHFPLLSVVIFHVLVFIRTLTNHIFPWPLQRSFCCSSSNIILAESNIVANDTTFGVQMRANTRYKVHVTFMWCCE